MLFFFFGGVGILSLNNLGDDHQLNSQYWLAQRTGTGCPIQSVGVFCDIKWCQSGESFHHCQSQHVTSCGYGSILISEHIYIYINIILKGGWIMMNPSIHTDFSRLWTVPYPALEALLSFCYAHGARFLVCSPMNVARKVVGNCHGIYGMEWRKIWRFRVFSCHRYVVAEYSLWMVHWFHFFVVEYVLTS